MLPLALGLASTKLPAVKSVVAGAAVPLSCTLGFDSIKQHHPIDDSCTPDGNGKPGSPQALQNDAKNNFCASGAPINLDFGLLRELQQQAATRVTFGGDSKLPADRSPLRSLTSRVGPIGEGSVGRVAAFVIDAHYSNVGQGESVNCKLTDKEGNDIHVVLGENSDKDDPCTSVTAEMSPHFRPDIWNPDALNQHRDHMYRFTGQMFFDASHAPCVNGTGPNPKRSSLWEIHPVYRVEVCADPSGKCAVDKEKGWEALEVFLGAETTETRAAEPQGSRFDLIARLFKEPRLDLRARSQQ